MGNTIYDEKFYKANFEGSYTSARLILPYVIENVHAQSIVDFGCGSGTWLRAAREIGLHDVFGIDFGENTSMMQIPVENYRCHDLTQSVDLGRKFDMAISLEVAEHLPETAAAGFVASLCRHADVVLFSAAIPAQGGDNHINEQWQSYWAKLFAQEGFEVFDLVRPRFWSEGRIPFWYRQNMLLYVSDKAESLQQKLKCPRGGDICIDMVHPLGYATGGMTQEQLRKSIFQFELEKFKATAKQLGVDLHFNR